MSELGLNDTTPLDKSTSSDYSNGTWIGAASVIVVVAIYGTLSWLDNTTELWPTHDNSLEACFWVAGITGVAVLIGSFFSFRNIKSTSLFKSLWTAFCFALISIIAVFLLSIRTVDIFYGRIDFPAGKTQTFTSLLRISRAYRTHGKGASEDIQTMPLWSNMDVTDDDYEFMLTNSKPSTVSKQGDEISSKGYFCAKVTMKRSGDALQCSMRATLRCLPGR